MSAVRRSPTATGLTLQTVSQHHPPPARRRRTIVLEDAAAGDAGALARQPRRRLRDRHPARALKPRGRRRRRRRGAIRSRAESRDRLRRRGAAAPPRSTASERARRATRSPMADDRQANASSAPASARPARSTCAPGSLLDVLTRARGPASRSRRRSRTRSGCSTIHRQRRDRRRRRRAAGAASPPAVRASCTVYLGVGTRRRGSCSTARPYRGHRGNAGEISPHPGRPRGPAVRVRRQRLPRALPERRPACSAKPAEAALDAPPVHPVDDADPTTVEELVAQRGPLASRRSSTAPPTRLAERHWSTSRRVLDPELDRARRAARCLASAHVRREAIERGIAADGDEPGAAASAASTLSVSWHRTQG